MAAEDALDAAELAAAELAAVELAALADALEADALDDAALLEAEPPQAVSTTAMAIAIARTAILLMNFMYPPSSDVAYRTPSCTISLPRQV